MESTQKRHFRILSFLSSLGRNGMEIEVGPVPQGLLRADAVAATELGVDLILEYQAVKFGP